MLERNGKRSDLWLLFIESVLSSYLCHSVQSITHSKYGKHKSCRLVVGVWKLISLSLISPADLGDDSGFTEMV